LLSAELLMLNWNRAGAGLRAVPALVGVSLPVTVTVGGGFWADATGASARARIAVSPAIRIGRTYFSSWTG
jgi:hypothetical protein